MTEQADRNQELHPILGIPWAKIPRHIAIIMDGNGRWAQQQGLPRLEGHRNGSRSVREVITECARLQIECLSLYSFSTENWKRPVEEVDGLMQLFSLYLFEERKTIMDNNIRVRHLGSEERLPKFVLKELHETVRLSADNTGMTLCLALNYSGRSEIVIGIKKLLADVQAGKVAPDAITEELYSDYLDTAGLPDPDILVRTSGERRISNFLLWQISYAELYVTDLHWPDFDHHALHDAIRDYAGRNRRFGGIRPATVYPAP